MPNPKISGIKTGDRIHHTTFGEGLVTKYEQPYSEVIVTITFNDSGSKRLLLNQAPMEIIEKHTAPPEKIDKCKVSRTYTTEFKIKVVKQALSEGRTVVRKQYNLPETTLRNWIKELS